MKLYRQSTNLIACSYKVDDTLTKLNQVLKKDLNKKFKSPIMNKLKNEIDTIISVCYPQEQNLDVFGLNLAISVIKDLYNTLNTIKGNYPTINKIKKILDENK